MDSVDRVDDDKRNRGQLSVYPVYNEMKFLDIILTKDLSLLLHAIHSPFYWRILKKTILFSGFKQQKIRELHFLE